MPIGWKTIREYGNYTLPPRSISKTLPLPCAERTGTFTNNGWIAFGSSTTQFLKTPDKARLLKSDPLEHLNAMTLSSKRDNACDSRMPCARAKTIQTRSAGTRQRRRGENTCPTVRRGLHTAARPSRRRPSPRVWCHRLQSMGCEVTHCSSPHLSAQSCLST